MPEQDGVREAKHFPVTVLELIIYLYYSFEI